MFILFGWGKRTRNVVGDVIFRSCSHCNTQSVWQLCVIRTWFTLFFIPVIPYAKSYQVSCPNCKSYIEVTKEVFDKIKADISSGKNSQEISDAVKYQGKTETQIAFLKEMENANRNN